MANNLLEILKKENYSLIASNGYYSFEKGIKPIMSKLLIDPYYFKDLDIADKVIGKATAMLLVRSKVRSIKTILLSKSGKEILDLYGIPYYYETLCDKVLNNKGDDLCPMEKTVLNIFDLDEAFKAITLIYKKLNQ